MTCPDRNDWQLFLDDEIDSPRAADMSRHLESCAACQAVCEELTGRDQSSLSETRSSAQLVQLIERMAAAAIPQAPESSTLRFPGAADETAPLGRLGSYAIIERIAEGSQGLLFRARDESLQRQVAIKVLHPQLISSGSARERILREARMGAALQSPHVVQVLHVGQEPGFPPYLVLEFVTGESLRDLLDRTHPVSAAESVRIVTETARGLAAAHRAGLIHRDVKPSNILLDQSGTVHVTDFGLAIDDSAAARLTQQGAVVGTPAYMSPEQIAAPQSIDARSDLYSLGVVFYELLTGEVPFRGTVRMTLLQITHDDPRPPRSLNESIPRDLETICLRLLQKAPDRRFSNVREVIEELGRWSSGHPILSRPVTRRERFVRWCRRNPVVSMLSAASSLLVLTLIVVLAWSAWRLAKSERDTRAAADAVARQRNAALETLSKLVFQLQRGFDDDEVDLDTLQKQSLEIAIDGLRGMRLQSEDTLQQDLPTAEALRRMAELLSGLEDSGQAELCLDQAASILTARLKDAPDDPAVLRGMIEILWLQDDLADADDPQDLAKLTEATQLARRLRQRESSTETGDMLAEALLREAQAQYAESGATAEALASESRQLCESLLPMASELAEDLRATWFDAVDLEYLLIAEAGRDAFSYLRERLSHAESFLPAANRDVADQIGLLSLVDRLLHELPRGASDERTSLQSRFDALVQSIGDAGRGDHFQSVTALQLLQAWTDERLAEDNDRNALRLLRATVTIAEQRLAVDPRDAFVRRQLALTWFNLGSVQSDVRGRDEDALMSFESSAKLSRELSSEPDFDVTDRLLFIDALVSAAEVAVELNRENWNAGLAEAQSQLQHLTPLEAEEYAFDLADLRARIQELQPEK